MVGNALNEGYDYSGIVLFGSNINFRTTNDVVVIDAIPSTQQQQQQTK